MRRMLWTCRYSDGLDKLLVFLGVVGSVITGAALPFFSVLLSRVTNAFLFPNNSNLEHTVNQTALYFLLLGIGIMVASFTGIAAWTLAGIASFCFSLKMHVLYINLKSSYRYTCRHTDYHPHQESVFRCSSEAGFQFLRYQGGTRSALE